jgi:hypothetical protein
MKQENSGVAIIPIGTIAELLRNPRLGTEIDLGSIDAPPLRVVWNYERQAGIRSYHGPAAIVEIGEVDVPVDLDAALRDVLKGL